MSRRVHATAITQLLMAFLLTRFSHAFVRRLPATTARRSAIMFTTITNAAATSDKTALLPLDTFGTRGDNTFLRYLIDSDPPGTTDLDQFTPRQIPRAHYTRVTPEPVPAPALVAASSSCATALGLDPADIAAQPDTFAAAFAGNSLLPGLDSPYCSNYGCHCYGTWFGQLGDGRAMALGEVVNGAGQRYELQLKGCGRSPYSRGFDGRAVLRSSVREFLVSEAMHHLGVPTTRALSLVTTGQKIRRPWYAPTAQAAQAAQAQAQSTDSGDTPFKPGKFSPDKLLFEPGAVVCRVSPSFLRVAQLELFALRQEYPELVRLANYACLREFPHLLLAPDADAVSGAAATTTTEAALRAWSPDALAAVGPPRRYLELFRCSARANARLVAQWLRVGYTQGNMNSDNTMLAGRTLDYGPYGWVEKYDPRYQPFTSDSDGKFAFTQQPQAMGVNMAVLGERTIAPLIKYAHAQYSDAAGDGAAGESLDALLEEVKRVAEEEYAAAFWDAYHDVIRTKLGFAAWEGDKDMGFWNDGLTLLKVSQVDYVLFYRLLGERVDEHMNTPAGSAGGDEGNVAVSAALLGALREAFYDEPLLDDVLKHLTSAASQPATVVEGREAQVAALASAWTNWLGFYVARLRADGRAAGDRLQEQRRANPKYVLRNWMAVQASEAAASGDFALIHELQELFTDPYGLQEDETAGGGDVTARRARWFTKTPSWARHMPGCDFYSCSS